MRKHPFRPRDRRGALQEFGAPDTGWFRVRRKTQDPNENPEKAPATRRRGGQVSARRQVRVWRTDVRGPKVGASDSTPRCLPSFCAWRCFGIRTLHWFATDGSTASTRSSATSMTAWTTCGMFSLLGLEFNLTRCGDTHESRLCGERSLVVYDRIRAAERRAKKMPIRRHHQPVDQTRRCRVLRVTSAPSPGCRWGRFYLFGARCGELQPGDDWGIVIGTYSTISSPARC